MQVRVFPHKGKYRYHNRLQEVPLDCRKRTAVTINSKVKQVIARKRENKPVLLGLTRLFQEVLLKLLRPYQPEQIRFLRFETLTS